jgi:hypothetical protein
VDEVADFVGGWYCFPVEVQVCFQQNRFDFEGAVAEDGFVACWLPVYFPLEPLVAADDSDFVADVAAVEVADVAVVELGDFLLLWQYLIHLQIGCPVFSFSSFCSSCLHQS